MIYKILKLIQKSIEKQELEALSYGTIDRLCLKYYPEMIFENKLNSLLNDLLNEGYLMKSKKNGVKITEKGIEYLEQNIEEE